MMVMMMMTMMMIKVTMMMMPTTVMMMNNSTCTATQHTRGATRRFRQGSQASRRTPGHDEHDGYDIYIMVQCLSVTKNEHFYLPA